MPRFMDFHDDLKLPQAAIDQIAQETRTASPTSSACGRSSFSTTPTGRSTACSKGRTRKPSGSITRRSTFPVVRCTRSMACSDPDAGR